MSGVLTSPVGRSTVMEYWHMFAESIRKGIGGALAASGLSGLAFAAGFQSEDPRPALDSSPRAVAVSSLNEESPVRLVQEKSLAVTGATTPDATGCSFSAGARSIALHIKIANAVNSKKPVSFEEIKNLFEALESEQGNTITKRFYETYALTFSEREVRALIIAHLTSKGLHQDLLQQLKNGSAVESSSSFRAVNSVPVSMNGVSFQANSQALKIHQSISADIQSGKAVPQASLKALFVALSTESLSGIPEQFFADYGKKFNSPAAVRVMLESLIPVVDGKLSLPRGDQSARRVAALRTLANSFPDGTPVADRRDIFESRRSDPDLNIRALGLMLCVNANITPQNEYLPSEIIRASQQLGYMNRLRGDEFRLGIMLRDSIKKKWGDFVVDEKTLHQIKMPLLRRAQTIERRNPGITEAILSVSEDAYVDFLAEHALHIKGARDALADTALFSGSEELFAVLHSAPEFHYGPARDIAKAFRLTFDPNKHVIKGERNHSSQLGEQGYFNLINQLSRRSQEGQQSTAASVEKRALIWLNMHGNSDGVFFTRGGAEEATGGASTNSPLLSSEFISWDEEATHLLKAGGLSDSWLIVDTCEGWNYSEHVNERLIAEFLKEMPIEQVVKEKRIPGRVIGSQCHMLSVGNMVMWYDEDLPTDKQQQVKISYSKLMFELMLYCQAKTMGVPIEEIKTIGATDKPFTCTFRDVYEVDERLANEKELGFRKWWEDQEGKLFDYLKTNRIDASVKDSTLIDIDQVHEDILENVRKKGHVIPKPDSKIPAIRRNSDYVHEISAIPISSEDARNA
jgi:hypothetical protein